MYILTKNEKIENISCVRFGENVAQLISKYGNSTTIKDIILTIADDTEDITTILDRVTNNYKNSTDYIEGKMTYHREYISESDIDRLKGIIAKYGNDEKRAVKWGRFSKWVVNEDNNDYLVKIYGDGYSDKQNVGVFVLNRNSKLVRIEAIYDVAVGRWKAAVFTGKY